MSAIDYLNGLSDADRRVALTECCAAGRWVDGLLARLPIASEADLLNSAAEVWWSLAREDWLEAFAAHPQIGDVSSLREKYAGTRSWAAAEQSDAAGADAATLQALAEGNAAYERRFGYIFIVCATGKSAAEMLDLLNERIGNSSADELPIAAAEQLRITHIRLQKLGS